MFAETFSGACAETFQGCVETFPGAFDKTFSEVFAETFPWVFAKTFSWVCAEIAISTPFAKLYAIFSVVMSQPKCQGAKCPVFPPFL